MEGVHLVNPPLHRGTLQFRQMGLEQALTIKIQDG
jgi:hypothetical protein